MKFLEDNLIKIGAEVETAEEAIYEAGKLLLKEASIEESYISAMVSSFKENGPYFVLAPNIAIPHARPEDGAKEASVSLLQLKKPVTFGHDLNDPVSIVFALGASSSNEHLILLKKLTHLLNNRSNVEVFINADSLEVIRNILNKEM